MVYEAKFVLYYLYFFQDPFAESSPSGFEYSSSSNQYDIFSCNHFILNLCVVWTLVFRHHIIPIQFLVPIELETEWELCSDLK